MQKQLYCILYPPKKWDSKNPDISLEIKWNAPRNVHQHYNFNLLKSGLCIHIKNLYIHLLWVRVKNKSTVVFVYV